MNALGQMSMMQMMAAGAGGAMGAPMNLMQMQMMQGAAGGAMGGAVMGGGANAMMVAGGGGGLPPNFAALAPSVQVRGGASERSSANSKSNSDWLEEAPRSEGKQRSSDSC